MKLIITDKFNHHTIEVNNPTHIPRVGEYVRWSYEPSPKVTNVIYGFEDGIIYVEVS